MVEKMKFISITGPKDDIDRVVDQYLSKYEIHLENALSELKTVSELKPYLETNPYKTELQTASGLAARFQSILPQSPFQNISLEDAVQTIRTLDGQMKDLTSQREALQKQADDLQASKNNLLPFADINYDIRSILHFRYVKFRFGRMPHEYYNKFISYVYDTIDTVIHKCQEDSHYVWIVYFVPEALSDKIDAIYASMHFERYFLPDQYEGTPTQAIGLLTEQIEDVLNQISDIDHQMAQIIDSHKEGLAAAHQKLQVFSTNFDVRKLAACTKQGEHPFYILCGWMTKTDADAFQNELKHDEQTFFFMEDNHNNIMSKPPTKLKNPRLFQPFELFIEMYGLPSYGEIDPTILLGLTYSFLFGFMFGDVGQGLCLMAGGFVLYHAKKINLAAIISCCGFFSTVFGFLFGSIFGFENIIRPVWLHPKEAMTRLPFIGNLNTVFVASIVLGMGIILTTMVFNIVNSLRSHDPEKAYFDTNGIAGMIFYGSLTLTIFLYMSGHRLSASVLLIVMLLPLLIIFFKEPLASIIKKKADAMPEKMGMFFVQGFFELFEICLSYFSNTLSFVRIGAFAVSHAAMMEVVLMLAGAEKGHINWLVIVLGNLFVCGMEGLIVGIQILRLEYYELFSRFYRGAGRAFKPYGKA